MNILNFIKSKKRKKRNDLRLKRRIVRIGSLKFKLISFTVIFSFSASFFIVDAFRDFYLTHSCLSFLNFNIQNIQVLGIKNISKNKIDKIIKSQATQIISKINIDMIKEEIEKIEWVENIFIQRRLPSSLRIEIQEREPIAIWQKNKNHFLVDKNGKVIHSSVSKEFSHLPIIVGDFAPLTAFQVIQTSVLFSNLKKRITGFICVRGRRWNVEIDNSLIVKLPTENIHQAFSVLSDMIKHNKISRVLMETVDLRDEDRVIIKFKEKYINAIKKNKKNKASL